MNDVIICPRCGYSFKVDIKLRMMKIRCPMCKFEFRLPQFDPDYSKEIDNKLR